MHHKVKILLTNFLDMFLVNKLERKLKGNREGQTFLVI